MFVHVYIDIYVYYHILWWTMVYEYILKMYTTFMIGSNLVPSSPQRLYLSTKIYWLLWIIFVWKSLIRSCRNPVRFEFIIRSLDGVIDRRWHLKLHQYNLTDAFRGCKRPAQVTTIPYTSLIPQVPTTDNI